ncbi:oligogalacturonate lyase family protein [Duganella sp. CT11-25]|uniref:oligogalacturonate lyase family protein n=1 Tax=Duganella sp. CT11-25 TaxID=3243027 RepID=UPI0039AEFC88
MKNGPVWALALPSILASLLLLQGALAQEVVETGSRKPMPPEWIDKDTGHRVVRLSGPAGPISNWYFHNNPFIGQKGGEGDKMVFSAEANGVRQIYTLNLKDRSTEQITTDAAPKRMLPMIARATREVLYQSGDTIYATSVDTRKTRKLYTFPADKRGGIATINADGTLFAGSFAAPEQAEISRQYPKKSDFFDRIYDAHLQNNIFTINIATGEFKIVHTENNWLGHIQFSPTDPDILMFCHEGPWHKVDRIWRYNIKDQTTTLMHKRSMPMEIAGHEGFAPDGQSIWFDLQKPRGETFYFAGADVRDGHELATYQLTADEWSIHYAISPDQKMFAGDGGDPTQVAHARDGMWIYAYYPDGKRFRSEKLVNMKAHDYRGLEPNVHFTPDGKWIVFGGDFEGRHETYAVEIAKTGKHS